MTGHNRITTKASIISERRFMALIESMIIGMVFAAFSLFAVLA